MSHRASRILWLFTVAAYGMGVAGFVLNRHSLTDKLGSIAGITILLGLILALIVVLDES